LAQFGLLTFLGLSSELGLLPGLTCLAFSSLALGPRLPSLGCRSITASSRLPPPPAASRLGTALA